MKEEGEKQIRSLQDHKNDAKPYDFILYYSVNSLFHISTLMIFISPTKQIVYIGKGKVNVIEGNLDQKMIHRSCNKMNISSSINQGS